MNLLYLGGYKRRFKEVINLIEGLPANSQVLELCFGDTYIANYCKMVGYKWKGIDINKQFVENAKKSGYNAFLADLTMIEALPKANICIMMGSLYHFYSNGFSIVGKMMHASDTIIISEPVLNLSKVNGLIGSIAKKASDSGKGPETFRFNRASLIKMLEENCPSSNYDIFVQDHGKDLLLKIIKK